MFQGVSSEGYQYDLYVTEEECSGDVDSIANNTKTVYKVNNQGGFGFKFRLLNAVYKFFIN
jgi:hypothetical protein